MPAALDRPSGRLVVDVLAKNPRLGIDLGSMNWMTANGSTNAPHLPRERRARHEGSVGQYADLLAVVGHGAEDGPTGCIRRRSPRRRLPHASWDLPAAGLNENSLDRLVSLQLAPQLMDLVIRRDVLALELRDAAFQKSATLFRFVGWLLGLSSG
jgi:hypothetical protein